MELTHEASTVKPPTYIIPRPGSESHVILGGTYIADNYSSLVDLPTSERILQECFKLCPGLAGPGEGKTWRDIEIVSHNVGLRPSRHGGARLELEKRTLGAGENADLLPKAARCEPRDVAVVHAYGIGGSGYVNVVDARVD
jgi:D-amino-acid oxidase